MLPPAVRFLFRVPCWPKIAPFHPSKRFSNKLPSRLFRFQRLQIPARKKLIATAFASGTGVAVSVVITSRTIHCESRDLKRAELLEATQARKEVERLKFRDLLSVLAPEWFRLLVAVIAAFAVAFFNIQIPLHLGEIVNVLSQFTGPSSPVDYMAQIWTPVQKIVMAYLAQGACTFGYISALSSLGERVAARLRRRLFAAVISQDMEFFDRRRSGELLDRLTSDVQDFKSSFKLCISQGLRSFAQTVGSIGALFYISPKLTGLMVIVVPGIVAVGSLMGSGLRFLSRKAQAQTATATAVADEAIGNVRTVKAFAMENLEIKLFHKEVERAAELYERLGLGIAAFQSLSNIALNGIVLGVLYAGGFLMSRSELAPGDLMSFLVATQTIQRSLGQMSLLFGQAIRGLSAGARVFEYIALYQPDVITDDRLQTTPVLRPSVKFQGVAFRYPTRPDQYVLEDFSLEVPAGAVVAVCGPSGAGKTTLASLLERFYDPNKGRILIGDKDLRNLNVQFLRRRILGLINQEPQLFNTTVRENIRYGRAEASDADVEAAARLANAHDFIVDFPDGYDTVVGERGAAVSGGQKQRLAIARALIKDPAILILDEATSALDAVSEKIVQEALERVMKNRTVIIIAHRLSTIKNADLIVAMNQGHIVEMGTHNELIKKKGFYWRLTQGQSLGA